MRPRSATTQSSEVIPLNTNHPIKNERNDT